MYGQVSRRIVSKVNRLLGKYFDLINGFKQVFLKKELVPVAIYIEPTNICNANCIFCAYQFYSAPKKNMEQETLKKVLDEASSLLINKVNLTPFAGEVLIDKKIVEKLDMIKSYGFKSVTTYTNLINLNNIGIKELLNSGLTNLNISTGPLEKELYTKIYRNNYYERFLGNLISLLNEFNDDENRTVKEIHIEFRSNLALIDCLNLNDYRENIEPLITANVKVSVMTTFDSWMGAINETDLLSGMSIAKPNGKKRIPCNRLNHVQVLSNGDMRVCGCRFNNLAEEDIFYIGNIRSISIKNAYNSDVVKDIKRSFLRNNPPEECQTCSWYS